jgi:hypothetical protein
VQIPFQLKFMTKMPGKYDKKGLGGNAGSRKPDKFN